MSGLLTVVIFLFKYCYTLIRYRKRCVLLATKLKYSVRVVHDGRSSASNVTSSITHTAAGKDTVVGNPTQRSFHHKDDDTSHGQILVGSGSGLARASAASDASTTAGADSRSRSSTMPS